MPIEFDITLDFKDMYRFNMYQAYSGFHGIFSIIIAVLVFALAIATYGEIELRNTVLYVVFGMIFLIYMPVSLYLRSKNSLKSSEVLQKPLHYAVDEKGFCVSQGEANAELLWEQIYKMVATKSNVLVYSNRINAYVIPRAQLGEKYGELAALAGKKLPKYRLKMK